MEDTLKRYLSLYDEVDVARGKLTTLLELREAGNMSDIGDYVDGLTESESKLMLRMIVYGAWKEFQPEHQEGSED